MKEEGVQAGEEGFLHRWSRRKLEAEQGEAGESVPAVKEETEEALLTDSDMPPLETLGESSDYSGFLSPGVSEGLRRMALRRLFRSAAFNVRDSLDDYDEDFHELAALGTLVPEEMRRRLSSVAERLAEGHPGDEPRAESPPVPEEPVRKIAGEPDKPTEEEA